MRRSHGSLVAASIGNLVRRGAAKLLRPTGVSVTPRQPLRPRNQLTEARWPLRGDNLITSMIVPVNSPNTDPVGTAILLHFISTITYLRCE